MAETEGVIKYQLHHDPLKLSADEINLSDLNKYRSLCFELELIGQNENRYQGYGYGNISQRYKNDQFIISGTQTGALKILAIEHYCLVTQVNLKQNSLHSIGQCKPSSEALTHASVYSKNPAINCVIHAHDSTIWNATQALKISHTSQKITYGTPEMAKAVRQLIKENCSGLFTMLGHEDGVIAYGKNFPDTFALLKNTLNAAKQMQQ